MLGRFRHGSRAKASRAKATSYKVIPSPDRQSGTVDPQSLRIGDVVVFPEVPVWTNVVVADTAVVSDRAAMVSAIAEAIKCKQPAEECLAERRIKLLERAGTARAPELPQGRGGTGYLGRPSLRHSVTAAGGYQGCGVDQLAAVPAVAPGAPPAAPFHRRGTFLWRRTNGL
jgi:hypothetical protein